MEISRITRSDLLDYLLLNERKFHGNLDLISFLQRVWNLSSMKAVDRRHSNAIGDIQTHVIQFADWDYNYLLYDYLKILECSDEIFSTFIETCLSPLTVSDQSQLNEMLRVFNSSLAHDGYQLVENGRRAGKPIYKMVKREFLQLENQEHQREPLLDQAVYQRILRTIHATGQIFESHPATYRDKSEEELRDHLLLSLTSKFSEYGSVTGETFNKSGKTDILVKCRGLTVFIAECKFWNGKENYIRTLSQLLGYLTWRDNRVAVIMFVQRKDISKVIQTIREVTPEHPNYLGYVSEEDASWINYHFHMNGDPDSAINLAVMLYHIPPVVSDSAV